MKKKLPLLLKIFVSAFILLNIMAAFHAYKFTHFYANKEGKRPKVETMNMMQKTSAVLFGVDYPKSVIEKSPLTPHTIIKIQNDHVQIQGWVMRVKEPKGTVILFHGHGSSKAKVLNEARAFNDMGYNSFSVDFRAHGNSSGEICTIGYLEKEDVKMAFDYVKSSGENNIVLWGISMGAAAITHAVDKYDLAPKMVILEMPFGSLYDAVKGRVRTMGLPEEPISSLLTFWGGIEQGFWAFNYEPSQYVKEMKMPVLLQWGVQDQRVTEKETIELFDNIAAQDKLLVKYQNSVHESLLTKEPEQWKTTVSRFLSHDLLH